MGLVVFNSYNFRPLRAKQAAFRTTFPTTYQNASSLPRDRQDSQTADGRIPIKLFNGARVLYRQECKSEVLLYYKSNFY